MATHPRERNVGGNISAEAAAAATEAADSGEMEEATGVGFVQVGKGKRGKELTQRGEGPWSTGARIRNVNRKHRHRDCGSKGLRSRRGTCMDQYTTEGNGKRTTYRNGNVLITRRPGG